MRKNVSRTTAFFTGKAQVTAGPKQSWVIFKNQTFTDRFLFGCNFYWEPTVLMLPGGYSVFPAWLLP